MQPRGGPAVEGSHPGVVTTDPPWPSARPVSSATPPFAALDCAPGLARGHVRATLAGWGLAAFTDTAVLIASELVSNAVEASAGVPSAVGVLVIRVCLIFDGDVLTIECWDQAPGVPVLRLVPELVERGRGLAIIDDLTAGAWGYRPAIGQPGKCVWAQILLRRDVAAPHLLATAPAMPAAADSASPPVPGGPLTTRSPAGRQSPPL
jgi:hypothetical protein